MKILKNHKIWLVDEDGHVAECEVQFARKPFTKSARPHFVVHFVLPDDDFAKSVKDPTRTFENLGLEIREYGEDE